MSGRDCSWLATRSGPARRPARRSSGGGCGRRSERGIDHLKIFATSGIPYRTKVTTTLLSFDEVQAAVEEAHKWDRPVSVHAVGDEGVIMAADAGADSVEHAFVVSEAGIEAMVRNNTTFSPQLAVTAAWNETFMREAGCFPEWMIVNAMAAREVHHAMFAKAVKAGLKMVAGVDNLPRVPLFFGIERYEGKPALVAELRFMVDGGMSPMQALQAATLNPARAFAGGRSPGHGRERQTGRPDRGRGRSAHEPRRAPRSAPDHEGRHHHPVLAGGQPAARLPATGRALHGSAGPGWRFDGGWLTSKDVAVFTMFQSPQVLALLSAGFSAVGTMLIQRGLRHSNFYAGFWINVAVGVVGLWAAVLLFVPMAEWDWSSLLYFVFSGVVGTAAGRLFRVASIEKVGAPVAAAVANLAPLIATALAILLLNERVTFAILAGTLVIVAGTVTLSLAASRLAFQRGIWSTRSWRRPASASSRSLASLA